LTRSARPYACYLFNLMTSIFIVNHFTELKMADVSAEVPNAYLKWLLLKHPYTLEMIQRKQSHNCVLIET
ncbi:hypothetical protein T10_11259, partial [Trichinella papuae]